MTLGYPDSILPYPAVQYIPLDINTKFFTKNWPNNYSVRLHISSDLKKAERTLKFYSLNLPDKIELNNRLLLILINAKAIDIFYRGYEVQIIGKKEINSHHLFTIPTQYFYKEDLIFNFFLPSGQQILKHYFYL